MPTRRGRNTAIAANGSTGRRFTAKARRQGSEAAGSPPRDACLPRSGPCRNLTGCHPESGPWIGAKACVDGTAGGASVSTPPRSSKVDNPPSAMSLAATPEMCNEKGRADQKLRQQIETRAVQM
ncbi:uncharacterized protein PSFLO_06949 [Pseudozyma flocculosa]|uniref:Uncharacterized protein n=1 Tax=Pseudozyma flocculosa TaxID=84751 RepID=A0A5C3FCV8_9BASI|nr:uncharacterized protein PSFLO_06949 [Pseudozyma flocculosa]